MTAFLFIFVSIIEYVGSMIAMLAIFRYPVSYYWPQMLFSASICSVISYAMSVENDFAFAPLVQVIVWGLCIWLMFNTPLLWSMIMCVSYLTVYIVFQGGIVYLLFYFGVVPSIISKTSVTIYLIQMFCAVVCALLGYVLMRKRIGFLFVPTSREVPYKWSKNGLLLFFGSVVAFMAIGLAYIFYFNSRSDWFFVISGSSFFIVMVLLYIMKRKNQEYVKNTWEH